MEIKREEIAKIVSESVSKSEVCRKLGLYTNGTGLRLVNKLIMRFKLNTSHFSHKAAVDKFNRKWKMITKICPVCGKTFETQEGHKREKITCSHSCSNTFFAKKRNLPEKYKSYRTMCFKNWEKKCLICGFDCVVEVHHLNHNHSDNRLENLIPLCPNHHQMLHTKKYSDMVKNEISKLISQRTLILND